ncbi:MAG: aa3-type cytochrome c oxidase subunit IV [Hyphomicrobium sp.]
MQRFATTIREILVGIDTKGGHQAMDYNEHNKTYAGFLRITKISIVLLVLLLVGMKVFLV